MKSGVCPKCNQASVHAKELGLRIGEYEHGVMIPTGMIVRPSAYTTYLCAACGFFETYVTDQTKLSEVAQTWPKVQAAAPGFQV